MDLPLCSNVLCYGLLPHNERALYYPLRFDSIVFSMPYLLLDTTSLVQRQEYETTHHGGGVMSVSLFLALARETHYSHPIYLTESFGLTLANNRLDEIFKSLTICRPLSPMAFGL